MVNLTHAQKMLEHLERGSKGAPKQPRNGAGKVFHDKAHKRMKNEKYYTPAWAVRCLLRQASFGSTIWEPAAGNGEIVRALEDAGFEAVGTDISPDESGDVQPRPINFLTQQTFGSDVRHIITNPPFGTGGRLAFQFCWHALRLTEQRHGKVAMLMRDDFDSAKGRRALFAEHPAFDRKIVMTDRIRWTNLPQSATAGPSGSHAWFVWDWSRKPGPAVLLYEKADEDVMTAAIDRVHG